MRSPILFTGIMLLIVVTAAATRVITGGPRISDSFLAALGFVAVLMIAVNRRLALAVLSVLGAALVVTVASLALDRYGGFPPNVPMVSSYIAHSQPILTVDEAMGYRHDHIVDLATVARDATEPESVFLVPWEWDTWRLFSERAVVVDGKAFPFRDGAMRQWYERYLAIYDEGAGYPDDVTESELLGLRQNYSGYDRGTDSTMLCCR